MSTIYSEPPSASTSQAVSGVATTFPDTAGADEPADIVRLVRPLGIGYAAGDFSHDCLVRLIDFPEMPLRTGTREAIKTGRSAQVIRTELPVGGRMIPVAYKRVVRRTWLKRLSALPRRNRTLHAWRMGQLLWGRKINTARPLVAIIPRRHEITRPSYLATAWIEGGFSLHAYYQKLAACDVSGRRARLRRAAASLGRLIGQMHSENISHRDLKPGNLLVVERDAAVESYLVDLDGARWERKLSQKTRLRNLARLLKGVDSLSDIGLTVRLRFLKAYLAELHHGVNVDALRFQWKDTWRQLSTTLRKNND